MGTLFNQLPRNYYRVESEEDIISEIEQFKEIQKKTGITYENVIETCKMLELRRQNNLYADNGDAFDEQMGGFGELLKNYLELQ
jgi:hypothetical protein